MARSCTCRNAGGAPTNDSDTPVFTSTVFYIPTHAPASIPGQPGRYMDEDL